MAKNLTCNVVGAGGGIACAIYGTMIGGPIGGIIGGVVGGIASSFVTKTVVDLITPDDLEEMALILR